jgi:hypothetical protein
MSLFRTKNIDAMLAAASDDGLKSRRDVGGPALWTWAPSSA